MARKEARRRIERGLYAVEASMGMRRRQDSVEPSG